jgi:hypothetical protein
LVIYFNIEPKGAFGWPGQILAFSQASVCRGLLG